MSLAATSATGASHAFTDPPARSAGELGVGQGHVLYWEDWGRADAAVTLLLHGGPGSGFTPALRRFFDPGRERVIAFDQRGCGRSRPAGTLADNETRHLVADIETLRRHLGVARWRVVGGSWGATLALAYAARHREPVDGLLLRGLFVPDAEALDGFFGGARAWAPEAWDALAACLPAGARGAAAAGALADTLAQCGPVRAEAIARAWWGWERALSGLAPQTPAAEALPALVQRYRIQAHYLAQRCWLDTAGVDAALAALAGLPVQFVHGRLDRVCRPEAAWQAHRRLPGSGWRWAEGAGHDPFHPAMVDAQRAALAELDTLRRAAGAEA